MEGLLAMRFILHTMRRQYPYTAYYVEGDSGWVVAFASEFPSIVIQGRTIEQARERLRAAVEILLEENEETTRESIGSSRILLVEEQTTGRPE